MSFPMYVPLNDIDHTSKDFLRQQEIIDKYIEKFSKEKNYEIINSCSGSFNIPRMFSYQVNFKNLYNENWCEHKYSDSYIKNYFKYKLCYRKHKNDLIYVKEHTGEFVSSCDTNISSSGYDIDVAICNHCDIAFNLTEINKGLWNVIKKDLHYISCNIENLWFNITMPIYKLRYKI